MEEQRQWQMAKEKLIIEKRKNKRALFLYKGLYYVWLKMTGIYFFYQLHRILNKQVWHNQSQSFTFQINWQVWISRSRLAFPAAAF